MRMGMTMTMKMTMRMRLKMKIKMRMKMRMSFVILIYIDLFIDSYFIYFFFIYNIKMSYYGFNRQEILQKARERCSKEKAAKYYKQNKEVIKEKLRNPYKNLSEEEEIKIKEYQKKRYQELI